jgi:hypothetical protein
MREKKQQARGRGNGVGGVFFVRIYNQAASLRFRGELTIYFNFKLNLVHSLLGHILAWLPKKEIYMLYKVAQI